MKQVFKVMWYDGSWMEEPKEVAIFEDEQHAFNFQETRWESDFHYVEREEVAE